MVQETSKTAARQGRNVPMTTRILVISSLVAFTVLALIYFVFWPWPEPESGTSDSPAITEQQRAPEGVSPAQPPADAQPPAQ